MVIDREKDLAIERCIKTAFNSGCPQDQVENLMSASYVPYPWQWRFHAAARAADLPDGPVDIGLGGARGPGKSHAVLSQVGLDDCQRVPFLKVLFLRQTATSAEESFDDLIHKTLRGRTKYHKTKNRLKFPNGSYILMGGFKDEKDIDKYIGIEYDLIVIEEVNQLTEEKVTKLRGSLRSSKPNWRPRLYTSFNPGGIGHAYVKETYVIPQREGTETTTRFIPSTYKENPALNKEYVDYLESLGGNLGRAWREGDFDIFEGQFFREFRYAIHVIAPFEIPSHWPRFRAIDPSGRSGFTSCGWYALDSDGRVYRYREHYGTGMDADEHADEIARLSEGESYQYTVIDTSAFSNQGHSETIAEIYIRHDVDGLIPAAKDRIPGWNVFHQYLRWDPKHPEVRPQLCVFSTCVNLIRQIPLAQHDELHPEDMSNKYVKVQMPDGTEGNEHWDTLDEVRYFLRTMREAKSDKKEDDIQKKLRLLKKKDQAHSFRYSRSKRS